MTITHGSIKAAGGLVQLLALVLLQCYCMLPLFSGMAHSHDPGRRCFGVHRLCGCSPERIASRTCCCNLQSPPSCCHGIGKENPMQRFADGKVPVLVAPPCGFAPDAEVKSLEKLEFLLSSAVPSRYDADSTRYPPLSKTSAGRIPDPPDPPPHIVSPA